MTSEQSAAASAEGSNVPSLIDTPLADCCQRRGDRIRDDRVPSAISCEDGQATSEGRRLQEGEGNGTLERVPLASLPAPVKSSVAARPLVRVPMPARSDGPPVRSGARATLRA